jgi:hypothetical protein
MTKIKNIKDVVLDKVYWLYSDFKEPEMVVVRKIETELNRIMYQRILENGMAKYEQRFAIISEYNDFLFENKKEAFMFYIYQAEENLYDAECILRCAKNSYDRNDFEN